MGGSGSGGLGCDHNAGLSLKERRLPGDIGVGGSVADRWRVVWPWARGRGLDWLSAAAMVAARFEHARLEFEHLCPGRLETMGALTPIDVTST